MIGAYRIIIVVIYCIIPTAPNTGHKPFLREEACACYTMLAKRITTGFVLSSLSPSLYNVVVVYMYILRWLLRHPRNEGGDAAHSEFNKKV